MKYLFQTLRPLVTMHFKLIILNDSGISPNAFSRSDLGSYNTEYFCYDAIVAVVISDGKISKTAFEYYS